MTKKLQVNREQSDVTFNKENHSPVSPTKDFEKNAQLPQGENAMIKKKLEEQNKKVVKLEERIKALQDTIDNKNSVIDNFERQRYIGERLGMKIDELVESVKDNNIKIQGVGPITQKKFDFHYIVLFRNERDIKLKQSETACVLAIYMLLLLCQDLNVPYVYWKDLVNDKEIHIGTHRRLCWSTRCICFF
ncbi:hypothetical protein BC833DRAFT_649274 [Globomyces pollinis-pini]|nr:hypothetical protein BC833DRAFT_649274 [Globomyces pollinis-pini]